jgi:streptomycin 6-kinase
VKRVPYVTEHLRRNWASYWPGADVDAMAADVEARVREAGAAWGLDGARPLPGGEVGVVLAGDDAVLKVSPRGHEEEDQLAAQADALEFWGSTGAVPKVLGRRDGGCTVLMERMVPGVTLDADGLAFEERLRTLGALARRLHAAGPAPRRFVPLALYARRWDVGALADARDDDVLIHADLHGGNVLRHGDAWRVIDPHAVRGDRHADIWALLDPLVPELPANAGTTAWRWLRIYTGAAGLDPQRAAAWVVARARGEAPDVGRDDPAWARRLLRMAAALDG